MCIVHIYTYRKIFTQNILWGQKKKKKFLDGFALLDAFCKQYKSSLHILVFHLKSCKIEEVTNYNMDTPIGNQTYSAVGAGDAVASPRKIFCAKFGQK